MTMKVTQKVAVRRSKACSPRTTAPMKTRKAPTLLTLTKLKRADPKRVRHQESHLRNCLVFCLIRMQSVILCRMVLHGVQLQVQHLQQFVVGRRESKRLPVDLIKESLRGKSRSPAACSYCFLFNLYDNIAVLTQLCSFQMHTLFSVADRHRNLQRGLL